MKPPYAGRLLILEDDSGVGNVIRLVAVACGFDARVVTRAHAFFSLVDEWHPTHISLDLVMPDMDGEEVLTELAVRKCAADVIISSGMGYRVLDAAGQTAREHGLNVIGTLAKPFMSAALRAMLLRTAKVEMSETPTMTPASV